ncbi:MAG: tetratricopeptide repeat protein [Flammeovirgaceae bacterium]
MRNIVTIFCLFLVNSLLAQSPQEVGDLLIQIPNSNDSVKVELFNKLAALHIKKSPQQTIFYASEAVEIAQAANLQLGLANAYYNLGIGYFFQASYPKALEPFMEAYHIYQKKGMKMNMAQAQSFIGGVHLRQKQYQLSLENYVQALNIFEEMMLSSQVAKMKVNIGEIYLRQGELQMALRYEQEAIKIAERKGMKLELAYAKGIIGQVYEQQGVWRKSLLFLLSALSEFKVHEHTDAKAEYSIYVARLERKMGDLESAETFAKQGLGWARDLQSKHWMLLAYEELARIYEAKGDYKASVDAYKVYNLFKDSIFNGTNTALLLDLQANFETQQQRVQLNLQKAQIEKLEDRRNFSILIALVFILASLGLAFSFGKIRQKKRQLEQSHKAIEEQNEEIKRQRAAIAQKNQEIEKKNRNIMSSLQYAKRIQRTLMPSEEDVLHQFDDGFIFLKPRDVVSGDFYWFDIVNDIDGSQKKIIAAVDSTGHGVPGALMSMIGLEQLTEIVNVECIHCSDLILNRLHAGVVNILKQNSSKNQDGMDMAICVIDEKNKTLEFAGARNGLFYIQNGQGHYLRGDRRPIGGEIRKTEDVRTFTKHIIPLEGEMYFYLFSDGFQDQFGGREKRKYSPRRFRELLLTIHQHPMEEQHQVLATELNQWMLTGDEEQIDDILVLGFRV